MTDVLDCINFNQVDDKTRITILEHDGTPVASGNWFQDQILNYQEEEVIEMTYDPLKNKLRLRLRGYGLIL